MYCVLSTSTFLYKTLFFTSINYKKKNHKNNEILGYGRFKDYTTTGIKIITFL